MLILWWQNKTGGTPPVAPPIEIPTGGWPSGRIPRRRDYDFLGRVPTAEEIKAQRIKMGIIKPDPPEAPDEPILEKIDATPAFDGAVFDRLQARLDAIARPDKTYDQARAVMLDPLLLERMEMAEIMLIALILADLE